MSIIFLPILFRILICTKRSFTLPSFYLEYCKSSLFYLIKLNVYLYRRVLDVSHHRPPRTKEINICNIKMNNTSILVGFQNLTFVYAICTRGYCNLFVYFIKEKKTTTFSCCIRWSWYWFQICKSFKVLCIVLLCTV